MQVVPQNWTKAQLHSSQVSLWNNNYIFEVCFCNTCFLTLGSRFETEAENNPSEPDSTHFHFTLSSPCVSSCLPASVTLCYCNLSLCLSFHWEARDQKRHKSEKQSCVDSTSPALPFFTSGSVGPPSHVRPHRWAGLYKSEQSTQALFITIIIMACSK